MTGLSARSMLIRRFQAACMPHWKVSKASSVRVQLLSWQRRRAQQGRGASSSLHRIAPQCAAAPLHLVAKPVRDASAAALDPRGAFIAQHSGSTAIWKVSMHSHCFFHGHAGGDTF